MIKVDLSEYHTPSCLDEQGNTRIKPQDDYFIKAVKSLRQKMDKTGIGRPNYIVPETPRSKFGIFMEHKGSYWLVSSRGDSGNVISQAAFFDYGLALKYVHLNTSGTAKGSYC